jgi:hypothetical protein
MKTIQFFTSALVATGSTVVALLTLSSVISADFGFASLAALGIAAFALFDYSRPAKSLNQPAQILRPMLPSESASPMTCSARRAA